VAEDLGEKTELPTAKRRADARAKGQVARSPELGVALDLIGGLALLAVLGPAIVAGCATLLRAHLGAGAEGEGGLLDAVRTENLGGVILLAAKSAAWIAGPFVLLMFVITAAANFVQVGPLLTAEPLRPKLENLSPQRGLKKIFGKRNVIRTTVGIAKLAAVVLTASLVVRSESTTIAGLALLELGPAVHTALGIIVRLLIWLLALVLVLGVIDWWYQRWQLTQDLKMTKQEVKDELRSMEGDLTTKGRRLRMARKLIMQRMAQAVPRADVVVTNPTHFAVAIKYDAATMEAPRVVAKGADWMAFRIRELAAAHGVPIVEKPPLARALYAKVEVGRQISPEFYEAVAEILAYVYRLEGRAA